MYLTKFQQYLHLYTDGVFNRITPAVFRMFYVGLICGHKRAYLKCLQSYKSVFPALALCSSPSFPLFQIIEELVGNTVLNCCYPLVHNQLLKYKITEQGGVVLIEVAQ